MRTQGYRLFTKRVQIALGWSVLVGMTAGINLVPRVQHGPVNLTQNITQHSMVIPPAAGAAPLAVPQAPAAQALGTGPRAATAASPSRYAGPNLSSLPKRERVGRWFAQFDQIRERAKMSGPEKATAIRLWASSFVTTSKSDSQDAQLLLTSMVQRYDRATREIEALPRIPETKNLQQGYLKFFRQDHSNFQQYLAVLNKQSTKAAVTQMSAGKQQLAEIDVRNKNLDRRIRREYGIAQID